jgi:hypothetical protein
MPTSSIGIRLVDKTLAGYSATVDESTRTVSTAGSVDGRERTHWSSI